MSKKEIVVRYDHLNNVVKLPTKINSFIIPYFASSLYNVSKIIFFVFPPKKK